MPKAIDNSPEAKAKRSKIARRSKQKGSKFELLCAKKIVEAAGEPFAKADCYRTPQSGGHRFAGANDLQISDRLLDIFPFGGEMKHRKTFRIEQMFDPTEEIRDFHNQVLAAVARDGRKISPLLVVRGNRGDIYCTSHRDVLNQYWPGLLPKVAGFVYQHGGSIWKMILFDHLLSALRAKAEVQRQVGVLKAAQTA